MEAVVRTYGLVRNYPAVRSDPVRALAGVNLELEPGRVAVITGPSGSGKTTLLSLIAGLDRPNEGTVELFGQRLSELSDAGVALLRRHRVGIVFQDFKLLRGMPCWENVALPLVPTGVGARQRRERASQLMERLGVGELADRRPEQLSGGQQQRVALARALVNEPDLVLADEPTSQIDAGSAALVLDVLGKTAEDGKTVLVATHDVSLQFNSARRFRLTAGRLEELT